MLDHSYFANLIWQVADVLRGPYRPPQYERVMLPMTVLRRFDCVLAPTRAKVLAAHKRRAGTSRATLSIRAEPGGRAALPQPLAARTSSGCRRPRPHRQAPRQLHHRLLAQRPRHLRLFEFEGEIEKMREANILYMIVHRHEHGHHEHQSLEPAAPSAPRAESPIMPTAPALRRRELQLWTRSGSRRRC